ncbi:MAG: hypothetical protein FJ149_05730 [Euryarchaeota archaeon]|nr:hypothetical protein [Euryarchaeota archaeon]
MRMGQEGRKAEGQKGRQEGRKAGRQKGRKGGRKAGRQEGRRAEREAGRQEGRKAEGQKGRQEGRKAGRRQGNGQDRSPLPPFLPSPLSAPPAAFLPFSLAPFYRLAPSACQRRRHPRALGLAAVAAAALFRRLVGYQGPGVVAVEVAVAVGVGVGRVRAHLVLAQVVPGIAVGLLEGQDPACGIELVVRVHVRVLQTVAVGVEERVLALRREIGAVDVIVHDPAVRAAVPVAVRVVRVRPVDELHEVRKTVHIVVLCRVLLVEGVQGKDRPERHSEHDRHDRRCQLPHTAHLWLTSFGEIVYNRYRTSVEK